MTDIVINKCYGGFNLSIEGRDYYNKLAGKSEDYCWDINRDDPHLVETVRSLGEAANGMCADLIVVTIPDDVKWHIDDYDGIETIHENHRSW
jgi:hypothetical protein